MEIQNIKSLSELDVSEYTKQLMNVVNHKLSITTLQQVEGYIDTHMNVMDREQANGRPLGPTVWFLYKRILRDLILHKEILQARADFPEYFWTYRNIR